MNDLEFDDQMRAALADGIEAPHLWPNVRRNLPRPLSFRELGTSMAAAILTLIVLHNFASNRSHLLREPDPIAILVIKTTAPQASTSP